MPDGDSHAEQLEALWAGAFGDAYVERNRAAGEGRGVFWQRIIAQLQPQRVLEVGCNLGANLRWLVDTLPPEAIFGLDINTAALVELHRALPTVSAIWGQARELPFRDRWFDLVFTAGVLIHQPPSVLPQVIRETVRCSARYVLCCEYYAENPTVVPYRGQSAALFKRDFGALYQELCPELKLREQGFLGRDEGWDDVTYWLFERPAG